LPIDITAAPAQPDLHVTTVIAEYFPDTDYEVLHLSFYPAVETIFQIHLIGAVSNHQINITAKVVKTKNNGESKGLAAVLLSSRLTMLIHLLVKQSWLLR
jgi:hypothetical protein